MHGGNRTPKVVGVLGLEKRDRSIRKAYIQQREEPGAILQIKVMRKRCSLRDLVPEVLDVTVPEHSYLSLVRGPRRAGNESYVFDLIECVGISVARELWRRAGTKLIRSLQGKRSDLRPLGEIRGREIWRRQLVVAGLSPRNVRRLLCIRSIESAHGEQLAGDRLPDGDSICSSIVVWKLRQVLLQLCIQRWLKLRI